MVSYQKGAAFDGTAVRKLTRARASRVFFITSCWWYWTLYSRRSFFLRGRDRGREVRLGRISSSFGLVSNQIKPFGSKAQAFYLSKLFTFRERSDDKQMAATRFALESDSGF